MGHPYELWAMARLRMKRSCVVERGMSCVPLRDDPICMACYEGERTLKNDSGAPCRRPAPAGNKKVRDEA